MFEFEFDFEGVVEDVCEFEGFALRELARDDGVTAWDGFIDTRCGVELAIEDDGEAAYFAGVIFWEGSVGGGVIFVGDDFGDFTEAASALVGHDEFDVKAAVLGGVGVGVFDHAAAHFGDFFNKDFGFVGDAGSGVLTFEGHGDVADGFLAFWCGFWVKGAVNEVEG